MNKENTQQSQNTILAHEPFASDPPVSMEDVQAVVNDDPSAITSGAKIRAKLGRGGLSTIQKHLRVIREDRALMAILAATPQSTAPAPPAMPAALAGNLWNTAWASAQQIWLGHSSIVTAERDTARKLLAEERTDIMEVRDDLEKSEATAKHLVLAASVDRAAMIAAQEKADMLVQDLGTVKRAHEAALYAHGASHKIALDQEIAKQQVLNELVKFAAQEQAKLISQLAEAGRKNDVLVEKLSKLADAASVKRD